MKIYGVVVVQQTDFTLSVFNKQTLSWWRFFTNKTIL